MKALISIAFFIVVNGVYGIITTIFVKAIKPEKLELIGIFVFVSIIYIVILKTFPYLNTVIRNDKN